MYMHVKTILNLPCLIPIPGQITYPDRYPSQRGQISEVWLYCMSFLREHYSQSYFQYFIIATFWVNAINQELKAIDQV